MNRKLHSICSCSISEIWKNYSIGTILLGIVPIIPLLGGNGTLPLTALILALLLFCYVRHERFKSLQRCAVFPYIAARILLVFTVFMLLVVAVSITSRHTLGGPLLAAVQSRASLYVSLFSLIVLWLMYPRMWSTTFCRECMLKRGLPQERSVLGHVYDRENGYLVRRMQALFSTIFILTVAFRIAEAYWQFSPFIVRMVYIYIPLSLVVADAVYVRSRYFVLGRISAEKERSTMPYGGKFKLVRVLVVDDGGMLLAQGEKDLDTPYSCYEPYTEQLSVDTAMRLVGRGVRFCYSTVDTINHRCIEHYLCFVDKRVDVANAAWFDREAVERKYGNELARLLCAELHRIYTVMQTSKVYDLSGKKLVELEGYKPKFAFRELRTTDVDFNDSRWMLLSRFNKDLTFFALRRAWYQYVEGLI